MWADALLMQIGDVRGMGWVGEYGAVPVSQTSPIVLTLLALRTHQLWVDAFSRTTVDITGLSQQDLMFLIMVAPTRPSRGPSLSPRMYITRSTAHPYDQSYHLEPIAHLHIF